VGIIVSQLQDRVSSICWTFFLFMCRC